MYQRPIFWSNGREHFVRAAGSEEPLGGPLQLFQFIYEYSLQDSLPNLVVLLRIFLTRAISVASCERSFSKLKLIKNYVCSSMSQTWLSDLAILSIERELHVTNEIDFNYVISDFAQKRLEKLIYEMTFLLGRSFWWRMVHSTRRETHLLLFLAAGTEFFNTHCWYIIHE